MNTFTLGACFQHELHRGPYFMTFAPRLLLDRWNLNGQLLVQYKGFNVTSQELSVSCCERYLTDEIINVLTIKYCDAANARLERDVFAMLPTDISKQFRESAVFNLSANIDISTVEMIFLPMLLHGNHLRLLVFNVRDCTVEYDDGFHYPVTSSVQQLSDRTLKAIFETTGLQRFQPPIWNKVQRFRVPMSTQRLRKLRSGSGVFVKVFIRTSLGHSRRLQCCEQDY